MEGIAWLFQGAAFLIMLGFSGVFLWLSWQAFKGMIGSFAVNFLGASLGILLNPHYALLAAILLSQPDYYNRGHWTVLAAISATWLMAVSGVMSLLYAKVNFEKAFRAGADIFPEDVAEFIGNVLKGIQSALGFWAAACLFVSYPLLLMAVKNLGGVSDEILPPNYNTVFTFSLQKAFEAEPTGLVQAVHLKFTTIDSDAFNLALRIVTRAYQLIFNLILGAVLISFGKSIYDKVWGADQSGGANSLAEKIGGWVILVGIVLIAVVTLALTATKNINVQSVNQAAQTLAPLPPASVTKTTAPSVARGSRLVVFYTRDPEANPSFSCDTARTPTEQFICSDADVARAERNMASEYVQTRAAPADMAQLQRSQRRFLFSLTSANRDKQTFLALYAQRTVELRLMRAQPAPSTTEAVPPS